MENRQLNFLKEYPKGIYKIQFSANLENGELSKVDEIRFRKDLEYLIKNEKEKIIKNPDEFFQKWLNGCNNKKPNLSQYLECNGFELQIPQIEIRKFEDQRFFGSVYGLIIASDFGYSGDFGDSVVFAINDILSKKVLTYHNDHRKNIEQDLIEKKELIESTIYQFGNKSEKYPFESLNPLKSSNYTWTLINISPKEVYDALREINFIW